MELRFQTQPAAETVSPTLQNLLNQAVAAYDDVSTLLHGTPAKTSPTVHLLHPSTTTLAQQLANNPAAESAVAATTTFETTTTSQSQAEPWLIIDPNWLATANDREKRLTLAHEMTHVLLRPDAPETPRWLSEGLAQYTATWNMYPSDEAARTLLQAQLYRQLQAASPAALKLPQNDDFYRAESSGSAYATALCAAIALGQSIKPSGTNILPTMAAAQQATHQGATVEVALREYCGVELSHITGQLGEVAQTLRTALR